MIGIVAERESQGEGKSILKKRMILGVAMVLAALCCLETVNVSAQSKAAATPPTRKS